MLTYKDIEVNINDNIYFETKKLDSYIATKR